MMKTVAYSNTDITTTYQYDDANRVISMSTKHGSTAIREYKYTYDGNSNILSVSGSENVTYTYDSRNRLTSSQRNGTTITYTYDKRDNLLEEVHTKNEKTIKSIQYTYSGDNRLESKTEDGTTITYEYDLNGNLTGDSEGNLYRYDSNDCLIYSKVDGVETTYTIGLDGYRSSKTTGNTTTYYKVNESGQVIEEVTETTSGNSTTETVTEIIWDGSQAVARKINGTYYYYVYNAHGDVIALIDNYGRIRNEYAYDDWGVPETKQQRVENPILYAGEYYDDETGQFYLRARYYQPELRRFTQEDPARDELNWYSYCENNPIIYIDPSGLDSYIIYPKNVKSGDKNHTMEDEARIRKKQLEETWKEWGPVHMIPVSTVEEFIEAWNGKVGYDSKGNQVSIEEVVIIAHGSIGGFKWNNTAQGYFYFENHKDRIYAKKGKNTVEDLDVKKMKWLTFSTCNSGNPDVYSLADAFIDRMIITRGVVAWDGGTIFNYKTKRLESGPYGGWVKEIVRQRTWYKYVDKAVSGKPKRKRIGRRLIRTR